MMIKPNENQYGSSEPVPAASQLTALPFLSAIDGFLSKLGKGERLRITLHRTMVREGKGYLQQVCLYLPPEKDGRKNAGRVFPTNMGVMGAAFESKKIFRTKKFSSEKELIQTLKEDMAKTGDDRSIDAVAKAYLAIPFLGRKNEVVLILYIDSWKLNLFADDNLVRDVHAMCNGFCGFLDWLHEEPFSTIRNFPLGSGEPIKGARVVYPQLQESIDWLSVPKFRNLASFNYEASIG